MNPAGGRARPAEALLARAAEDLRAAGVPSPRAEAEALLALATCTDRLRAAVDPPDPDAAARARFADLVARRARREPMAHLSGEREFRSLAFRVTRDVLVPRPETEHVVEAALAEVPPDAAALVADVGTGSGCIAVAFAAERPRASVVAIDRSAAALAVARGNAERHGVADRVRFLRGDLLEALRGPFDLVLSNPPYVADGETVDPECLHEPRDALFAGPDGLDAYRRLAPGAARVLRPGGLLLLETPGDRVDAIAAILRAAGLVPGAPLADLAGRPRVLGARAQSLSR